MRWGAAAAILLLAAGLRCEGLERESLAADELHAVHQALAPLDRLAPNLRSLSGATPGHTAGLRFAALYGLRELPLRLLSALAGAAAVAAAMLLLRDLFGGRAALVGGLLLAASPLHVAASRQALAPALASATAILLAWLLWRLRQGHTGLWRTAFAAGLALYCGYDALIVLAAGLGSAAIGVMRGDVQKAAAWRVLGAAAIGLALFAPWGLYDLPTEPGPQFTLPNLGWHLAWLMLAAPLLGDALGQQAGLASPGTIAVVAVLVGLSLLGIAAAWQGRRAAASFLGWLLVLGVASLLITARLGPYAFNAMQLLFLLPLYFGVAGFGLEQLARRLPWRAAVTPLCLLAAGILACTAEWPALAAQRNAPAQNWRGAFDVILRNLGPDDKIAAPSAGDAAAFYGLELGRRLPAKDRPSRTYSWLARSERSWLIVGDAVRLHPEWSDVYRRLGEQLFLVNLSPSAEPSVFFLGTELHKTYLIACHFELPAEVVARQTILRDCLREVGAKAGPMHLLQQLLHTPGVSLGNPSLPEVVTLLAQAGKPDEAKALADALAGRERE